MKKIIPITTILLSIIGILGMLSAYFILLGKAENLATFTFINIHIPFNFDQIISYFLFVVFIIASLWYIQSNGKEKKLLRFFYSILIIKSLISIIIFIAQVLIQNQAISEYIILFSYGCILKLFYIGIGIYFLKILNKEKDYELGINENTQQSELIDASKFKRFCNFVIDSFITIQIAFYLAMFCWNYFVVDLLNNHDLNMDHQVEKWLIWIVVIIVQFLYYSLFEYFTNATPGKFLTNTLVVNANGQPPSMKTIIKRTLSRMIPFDALSFFTHSNWHDSFSDTYVVNRNPSFIKDKTILWIFILILSFGGLIYFFLK